MANRFTLSRWGAIFVMASALARAESPAPSPSIAPPPAAESVPGNPHVTPQAERPSAKSALSDAFIAQGLLRIYLDRPASVTVYNSRGQQVFHLESERALESVPLHGLSTGFLYLTVRAGNVETTKKLVYTGK